MASLVSKISIRCTLQNLSENGRLSRDFLPTIEFVYLDILLFAYYIGKYAISDAVTVAGIE